MCTFIRVISFHFIYFGRVLNVESCIRNYDPSVIEKQSENNNFSTRLETDLILNILGS